MSSAQRKPPVKGDESSSRHMMKICDACGEIFNNADPKERAHHAQPDHKPMLPRRDH